MNALNCDVEWSNRALINYLDLKFDQIEIFRE